MVFNLFHSNGRNSMHLFHQLPAFTTDHTVICKHHSPLTSSNNHHDWYKNRLRCQYNSTRTLKPHLTAVLLPSTPSGFSSSPDILIQYHSYLFMFLKIDTRVLSTFLAHSLRLLEQFHLILIEFFPVLLQLITKSLCLLFSVQSTDTLLEILWPVQLHFPNHLLTVHYCPEPQILPYLCTPFFGFHHLIIAFAKSFQNFLDTFLQPAISFRVKESSFPQYWLLFVVNKLFNSEIISNLILLNID